MNIDEFGEHVLSLRANNFMALNGAAAGIVGSADSGTSAVAQLQRSAVEFIRLYKQGTAKQELLPARRDVTGKIMVALTVGAISQERADELVRILQDLMKERK